MHAALAYVWTHIVAFVSLFVTVSHIAARWQLHRRIAMISNVEKIVPIVVQALSKAAEWEAGKPVSLDIPADSMTVDLTAEGLGKVTIAEAGTTLTFSKAV